jgi:acyl-CoA thioester hydrolase
MSKVLITYRGAVHQWHCDHMGHMNVMWYVGKFDEATWSLAAMMGMTGRYLKEARRGMAAVDQRIAYRREALPGDVVTIRTSIIEVRPRSVRFVHEMRRDDLGDLLATMVVTGVHIDGVDRRATPFAAPILAAAQAMLATNTTLWDSWPPAQAYLE